MTSVAMSACAASASVKRRDVDLLIGPADRAAEHDRRRRRQMAAQPLDGGAELPRPRPRHRIVERDDEARARRGVEPPLDQVPGLEIVGQRQRAEIVAERRADPRRDREHRGDAGHDRDVERAPSFPVRIRSLRRPPPPWRTRRDRRRKRRRRCAPCCRMTQRRGGAGALLAIVGRVAGLVRAAPARDRDRARSRRARVRQRAPRRPPA